MAPVAAALDALVASAEERRSVARRGLAAALRGVPESIEAVAGQVDEEQRAVGELRDAAHRVVRALAEPR